MVAQPLDLVYDFVVDVFEEVRVVWVERAREHVVVPEEDSEAVALFVEWVLLELSASPDSQHVDAGRLDASQELLVSLGGVPLGHCIAWDPVCALGEDIHSIDLEDHREADIVLFVDDFEFLESDLLCDGLSVACDLQWVQWLFAESRRPPEFRVFDIEVCRDDDSSPARDDGCRLLPFPVEEEFDINLASDWRVFEGVEFCEEGDLAGVFLVDLDVIDMFEGAEIHSLQVDFSHDSRGGQ